MYDVDRRRRSGSSRRQLVDVAAPRCSCSCSGARAGSPPPATRSSSPGAGSPSRARALASAAALRSSALLPPPLSIHQSLQRRLGRLHPMHLVLTSMAVREAIPKQSGVRDRAGGLVFRQVAVPGRDPRGAGLPLAAARSRRAERIRDLNSQLRDYCAENYDPRRVEEERWVPDEILRDLGEIGVLGLYVDERYGGQGLSQTGYARVFETIGEIDATLAIVLGVHQSIGFKGISLFGTDEQKERWLPDLATGPQARRLRPDRARGGLRRLRAAVARRAAARRLLGAERGEALHRQRLARRRDHDLRPLRGRRQGQAHRARAREGHGGLRGRRALRHDGPARQRPAPPLLQGRPRPGRERARRARRGLPGRDADPQQRAHRARHRLGRRRQDSCST